MKRISDPQLNLVGGTGRYLNRSATFEPSVLSLVRTYAATVTLSSLTWEGQNSDLPPRLEDG